MSNLEEEQLNDQGNHEEQYNQDDQEQEEQEQPDDNIIDSTAIHTYSNIDEYLQPVYRANRFLNSPMILSDPFIKEGMKKYVSYTVAGSAMPPGASRRFSDFYTLRQKLLERWPGIYIPNIPPKKVVNNLETRTIESRMRHLNLFCLKLSKYTYIFESEEMKLFQSNNSNIAKAIEKMPKLSYKQMLDRYTEAFPGFYESYDIILGKGKLNEFQSFLKKSINNLKYIRESVASSINKKKEEFEDYILLLSGISLYEKTAMIDFSNNDPNQLIFSNPNNTDLNNKIKALKSSFSNPYVLLDEWLDEERMDIEAMTEALASIVEMNDTKEKLKQKLESIDNSIKAIQYGTTNLKNMFSFKNKEATKSELDNEKVKTEEECGYLETMVKMVSYNMECQLEAFKEEKMNQYYIHLKLFAEMQKNNNNALNDIWEMVANSLDEIGQ